MPLVSGRWSWGIAARSTAAARTSAWSRMTVTALRPGRVHPWPKCSPSTDADAAARRTPSPDHGGTTTRAGTRAALVLRPASGGRGPRGERRGLPTPNDPRAPQPHVAIAARLPRVRGVPCRRRQARGRVRPRNGPAQGRCVGEAKSNSKLGKGAGDTDRELDKLLDGAALLRATSMVLSTSQPSWPTATVERVRATSRGVAALASTSLWSSC